jgi:hypothetical protein
VDRTLFHGGLGAVTTGALGAQVALVDARDLALPLSSMADLPTDAVAVAVRAPYLYFLDAAGFGRLDIDDIAAPVVDTTWRADLPTAVVSPYGFVADDTRALWFSNGTGSLWLIDLVAGGAALLPGQGSFGPVIAARSIDAVAPGALLSAHRQAITLVSSPFTDGLPQSAVTSLLAPVVISAPTITGLYTPLTNPTGDPNNAEVGALALTYAQRADARTPIVRSTDPHGIPGHITIGDDGAIDAFDAGISVAWPDAIDAFYAPVGNGCIGAALAVRNDLDCVFPGCPADLHVLSFCTGAVDVAPLASFPLPAFLQNELPEISSYAQGATLSFYGLTNAAVVDLTDPLAPTISSFLLEELVGARFANGAAQGAISLSIVQGAGGAPPVAVLMPLTDSVPVNLTRWELAAMPGDDIRRRVLGVAWPRAFIGDWSGPSAHEGHRVDIYDISASPPVVTDSIPIASEPTGLSIQDTGDLVVVRGDGITIISPPCGP